VEILEGLTYFFLQQAQGMRDTLKSGLGDLERSLDDSVESHSSWTRNQLLLTINSGKNGAFSHRGSIKMLNFHRTAFEEQIHTKRARLEAMDTLQTDLETNHSILREGLVSTSQHVELFSKQITSTVSNTLTCDLYIFISSFWFSDVRSWKDIRILL
jgi:hypothetical protein